jgi:hypothetical protein
VKPLFAGGTALFVGTLLVIAELKEFYVGAIFLAIGVYAILLAIRRSKTLAGIMRPCRSCDRFIDGDLTTCPFCGRAVAPPRD